MFFQQTSKSSFFKVILCFVTVVVSFNFVLPPPQVMAQVFELPPAGTLVPTSPAFTPPILLGVTINPDNPLNFKFILNTGNPNLDKKTVQNESQKLIKYFLASLTTPEKEMWVNLSPYEKDRIVPKEFGTTEMGRDLLAQDYILKQLTASLIYPEKDLGKKFWDRIYKKAYETYGTTEIPVNTFNKVWIIPDKAVVAENGTTAIVTESHLKVMLEADYFLMTQNRANKDMGTDKLADAKVKELNDLSSALIKEIILPEIEKEVNTGKNFALLRQIYNSMILALWYKRTIKDSILSQVYVDQNKTKGVDIDGQEANAQKIYEQYLNTFKAGVFNFIKEDYDPYTKQNIPRKYFSGGTDLSATPQDEVDLTPGRLAFVEHLAEIGAIKIVDSAAVENANRETPAEAFPRRSNVTAALGELSAVKQGIRKIRDWMSQRRFKFVRGRETAETIYSVRANDTTGKEFVNPEFSNMLAEKGWEAIQEVKEKGEFIATGGVMSGADAAMIAEAGGKFYYISGWQVSHNWGRPDLAKYVYTKVLQLGHDINEYLHKKHEAQQIKLNDMELKLDQILENYVIRISQTSTENREILREGFIKGCLSIFNLEDTKDKEKYVRIFRRTERSMENWQQLFDAAFTDAISNSLDMKKRADIRNAIGKVMRDKLTDYLIPGLWDLDTLHQAGPEMVEAAIDAGVGFGHGEDQPHGIKKCGHMAGKAIISIRKWAKRIREIRFHADLRRSKMGIVARSDAKDAKLLESNEDPKDGFFILGLTNKNLWSLNSIIGLSQGHLYGKLAEGVSTLEEAANKVSAVSPAMAELIRKIWALKGMVEGQQLDQFAQLKDPTTGENVATVGDIWDLSETIRLGELPGFHLTDKLMDESGTQFTLEEILNRKPNTYEEIEATLQKLSTEWNKLARLKTLPKAVEEYINAGKGQFAQKSSLELQQAIEEWRAFTDPFKNFHKTHSLGEFLAKAQELGVGDDFYWDGDQAKTYDDFYQIDTTLGIENSAIRALVAIANGADGYWMEDDGPSISRLRKLVKLVRSVDIGKDAFLGVNLSPSFNWFAPEHWKDYLTPKQIANIQEAIRDLGKELKWSDPRTWGKYHTDIMAMLEAQNQFSVDAGKEGGALQWVTIFHDHATLYAIWQAAKQVIAHGGGGFAQAVQAFEKDYDAPFLKHQDYANLYAVAKQEATVEGGTSATGATGEGLTEGQHDTAATARKENPAKKKGDIDHRAAGGINETIQRAAAAGLLKEVDAAFIAEFKRWVHSKNFSGTGINRPAFMKLLEKVVVYEMQNPDEPDAPVLLLRNNNVWQAGQVGLRPKEGLPEGRVFIPANLTDSEMRKALIARELALKYQFDEVYAVNGGDYDDAVAKAEAFAELIERAMFGQTRDHATSRLDEYIQSKVDKYFAKEYATALSQRDERLAKMKKTLFGGNWKIRRFENAAQFRLIAGEFRRKLAGLPKNAETVIFVDEPWVREAAGAFRGSNIAVGVESFFFDPDDDLQAQIEKAVAMGATYTNIGHSMHRHPDEDLQKFMAKNNRPTVKPLTNEGAAKIMRAILADGRLIPWYTIEETGFGEEAQREIEEGVTVGLAGIPSELIGTFPITEEPSVLISTPGGAAVTVTNAKPGAEDADRRVSALRAVLARVYGEAVAAAVNAGYGASVKPENSQEIFAVSTVRNALIGGASWNSTDFYELIMNAINGTPFGRWAPVKNVSKSFGQSLGEHGLAVDGVEAVRLRGEMPAEEALADNLVRFTVEMAAGQALGSILLAGSGEEGKKVADATAGDVGEKSIINFTKSNPKYAIAVKASEAVRDASRGLQLGRIYFSPDEAYKKSYDDAKDYEKTGYKDFLDADGKIDFKSQQDEIAKLENRGITVFGLANDALEHTNGHAVKEAKTKRTSAWAVASVSFGDLTLISDKSRTAGIAYSGPAAADLDPLDLPSVALPKVAKAMGMAVGSPEYAKWMNSKRHVVLGPRKPGLAKPESGDRRHEDIINDLQALKVQFPGMIINTPGDGEFVSSAMAVSGVPLDGYATFTWGRRGGTEAAIEELAASLVHGGHFTARNVSPTGTAERLSPENASQYTDKERESQFRRLGYPQGYEDTVRTTNHAGAKGVVAFSAVTGAAEELYGRTFAQLMQRVTFEEIEGSKAGNVVVNTLVITPGGSIFVVRTTLKTVDLVATEASLKTASPEAQAYAARIAKREKFASLIVKAPALSASAAELVENFADIVRVRPDDSGVDLVGGQEALKGNRRLIDLAREITDNPNSEVSDAAYWIASAITNARGVKIMSADPLYRDKDAVARKGVTPATNMRTGGITGIITFYEILEELNAGAIAELALSEKSYSGLSSNRKFSGAVQLAHAFVGSKVPIMMQADHRQLDASKVFALDPKKVPEGETLENFQVRFAAMTLDEREPFVDQAVRAKEFAKYDGEIADMLEARGYHIDFDPSTTVDTALLKRLYDEKGLAPLTAEVQRRLQAGETLDKVVEWIQSIPSDELRANWVDENRIAAYREIHKHAAQITIDRIYNMRVKEAQLKKDGQMDPDIIALAGIEERHIDDEFLRDKPSEVEGTIALMQLIAEGLAARNAEFKARFGFYLVDASKMSYQTGTAHGVKGLKVNTTIFAIHDAILGILGVQHGASGLTDDQFMALRRHGIGEVHLATSLQNLWMGPIARDFPEMADTMWDMLILLMNPTAEKITDNIHEYLSIIGKDEPWLLDYAQSVKGKTTPFGVSKKGQEFSVWDNYLKVMKDTLGLDASVEADRRKILIMIVEDGDDVPKEARSKLKDLAKFLNAPLLPYLTRMPEETEKKIMDGLRQWQRKTYGLLGAENSLPYFTKYAPERVAPLPPMPEALRKAAEAKADADTGHGAGGTVHRGTRMIDSAETLVFRQDDQLGNLQDAYPDVYTSEVLQVLEEFASYTEEIEALSTKEAVADLERFSRKEDPGFLPETVGGVDYKVPRMKMTVKQARAGDFEGAPVPKIFLRPGATLTGPTTRDGQPLDKSLRSIAYQWLSGAEYVLEDGEDSLGQTHNMSIDGIRNLKLAITKDPAFMKVAESVAQEMIKKGKRPADWNWRKLIDENYTVPIYRVRGSHLGDRHLKFRTAGGREIPISATLVDMILYFVNNYEALLDAGLPLAIYYPKVKSAEEAALVAEIPDKLENTLEYKGQKLSQIVQEDGKPGGILKVAVLIENVNAAMQMMEIRAALGRHLVLLNTARWDYLATVIKAKDHDPDWVPEDFGEIGITYPFMHTFENRVWRAANTPDKNGNTVLWEGGMEVQIPTIPDDIPQAQKDEYIAGFMAKARANKTREAQAGAPRAWVAHPDMVDVVATPFKERYNDGNHPEKAPVIGQKQNLDGEKWTPLTYTEADQQAFFELRPAGQRKITLKGLDEDISVYIQYKLNVLTGQGAASIKPASFFANSGIPYLMEDRATDEGRGSGTRKKVKVNALFTEDDPDGVVKAGDPITRELFLNRVEVQFGQLLNAPDRIVNDYAKPTILPISRMALEKFVLAQVDKDIRLPWSVDLETAVLGVTDPKQAEKLMDESINHFARSGGINRMTENPQFVAAKRGVATGSPYQVVDYWRKFRRFKLAGIAQALKVSTSTIEKDIRALTEWGIIQGPDQQGYYDLTANASQNVEQLLEFLKAIQKPLSKFSTKEKRAVYIAPIASILRGGTAEAALAMLAAATAAPAGANGGASVLPEGRLTQEIPLFSIGEPTELPLRDLGVDVVVEATGRFTEKANKHLEAGAGTVIISAPSKMESAVTITPGVNGTPEDFLNPDNRVFSTASCTTNSLAAAIKTILANWGIKSFNLTTVHAKTESDSALDDDFFLEATGAAKALGKIFPELLDDKGDLIGSAAAVRGNSTNGSVSIFQFTAKNATSVEEIQKVFEALTAPDAPFHGILKYQIGGTTKDGRGRAKDILGTTEAGVFQADEVTVTDGTNVQVKIWYDNVNGYANRVVDMIALMGARLGRIPRVFINGFGEIGRAVFRNALQRKVAVEWGGFNDLEFKAGQAETETQKNPGPVRFANLMTTETNTKPGSKLVGAVGKSGFNGKNYWLAVEAPVNVRQSLELIRGELPVPIAALSGEIAKRRAGTAGVATGSPAAVFGRLLTVGEASIRGLTTYLDLKPGGRIKDDLITLRDWGLITIVGSLDNVDSFCKIISKAQEHGTEILKILQNKTLLPTARPTKAQRDAVKPIIDAVLAGATAEEAIAQVQAGAAAPANGTADSMGVGINGAAGDIGSQLFRNVIEDPRDFDIRAANDPSFRLKENGAGLEGFGAKLKNVLKPSAVFASHEPVIRFEQEGGNYWLILSKGLPEEGFYRIRLTDEKEPEKIGWDNANANIIFEASGAFTHGEETKRPEQRAKRHLEGGAKKVIITAPSTKDIPHGIVGVSERIDPAQDICSGASCTAGSLIPVKVLNDAIGIESYNYTTTLAMNNELRRWAARQKIDTSKNTIYSPYNLAAIAFGMAVPELAGKGKGFIEGVDIMDGSTTNISIVFNREVTTEEVNRILKEAASKPSLKGIMAFEEEGSLPSDQIVNRRESAIVHGPATIANGRLVTIRVGYANVYGFSRSIVALGAQNTSVALKPGALVLEATGRYYSASPEAIKDEATAGSSTPARPTPSADLPGRGTESAKYTDGQQPGPEEKPLSGQLKGKIIRGELTTDDLQGLGGEVFAALERVFVSFEAALLGIAQLTEIRYQEVTAMIGAERARRDQEAADTSGRPKGGIDLNPAFLNLQIKRDGNGIPLPMNMQPIGDMKIDGFYPVIINIQPATNLPLLLGLVTEDGQPANSARDEKPIADKMSFKREPIFKEDADESNQPRKISLLN